MRYFIAHIHRLRDEETEASPTEELRGLTSGPEARG